MAGTADTSPPAGRPLARLGPDSVGSLGASLPRWSVEGDRLVREVKFETYLAVLDFLTRLAGEAERLAHHPDVVWRYDRLELVLTTHDVGGISSLDVELARIIDAMTPF